MFENDGTPTSDDLDLMEISDESEDTNKDESKQDDVIDFDVEFLGKPTRPTKTEAKTLIQKGLNYSHVLEKANTAEAKIKELERQLAQKQTEEATFH